MASKIGCIQQLAKYRKLPLQESHPGVSYEQMVKQREEMNVVIGNLWQIIDVTLTTRSLLSRMDK